MAIKTMKKCAICKKGFEPVQSSLEKVCSNSDCRFKYAMMVVEKNRKEKVKVAKRQSLKEKEVLKEAIKSKSDYLKELQKFMNLICRLIDKDCTCISCGKFCKKPQGGHYLSVGANPYLRFNLMNIWQQCYSCNCELSGNLLNYQKGLKKHFGIIEVLDLELSKPLHLSIPELKEKIVESRLLVKEFEAANKMVQLPRNASERLEMREYVNKRMNIY